MGDVAQILGGVGAAKGHGPLPPGHHPSRAMKMMSMPKEVMELLSGNQDPNSAALPPVVPTLTSAGHHKAPSGDANATTQSATTTDLPVKPKNAVKVGNKWISPQKSARKWVWAPFASSARTDGLLLQHWVRADVEYPDYPYARFDIHLDPVTYTDEEYRRHLQHDTWTKSETDQLMELARKYDLRWPVIYDRWTELFPSYYTPCPPSSPAKTTTSIKPEETADAQLEPTATTNSIKATTPSLASSRKLEDIQHRYYSVAAILTQLRIAQEAAAEAQALGAAMPDPNAPDAKAAADTLLIETAAAKTIAAADVAHQPLIHQLGTGTSNKVFDLNYERERRAHLEALWHRTKEEEEEEVTLKKELRVVEAQIRKLKKSGGHILAAASSNNNGHNNNVSAMGVTAAAAAVVSGVASAASSRQPSRAASPIPSADPAALLDQSFASTAPTPVPQTPYLQSGRLVPPATGGPTGLNKTLLARMDTVLAELKIPPRPLPTKRVCDLYDSVRKDIVTLLTLQKMVLQKEGQLQTKRLKLAKMGGPSRALDEETALGTPPPAPAPPVATTPAAAATTTAAAAAPVSSTSKGKVPRSGSRTGKQLAGGVAATKKAKAAVLVTAEGAAGVPITAGAVPKSEAKSKAVGEGKVKGEAKGSGDGKVKGKKKKFGKKSEGKKVKKKAVPKEGASTEAPAAGGKAAARKSVTKRKRKSESKSPPPAASAALAATSAVASAAAPATTALPPAAPVPVAAAVATPAAKAEGGDAKPAAKKRARKT